MKLTLVNKIEVKENVEKARVPKAFRVCPLIWEDSKKVCEEIGMSRSALITSLFEGFIKNYKEGK